MEIKQLQKEQAKWSQRNFGEQPAYRPLLGVGEEVGELNHAHLKMEQGIRGSRAEHIAAAKDAVGDIVIYLADYCTRMGFDLEACVSLAWDEVKERDWKMNPQGVQHES